MEAGQRHQLDGHAALSERPGERAIECAAEAIPVDEHRPHETVADHLPLHWPTMHVTGPLSRHFTPDGVVAPDRRGEVAWSQFNSHYPRLQHRRWQDINLEFDGPWWRRWLRRLVARSVQRSDAFLNLEGKARIFSQLPLPRDPDIVFFGAEVGWEAVLLRALFGAGGRLVLVDCDPEAHRRFLEAPPERSAGDRLIRREVASTEYVHADFFDWSEAEAFDVGIDWGLLEHFRGQRKAEVLARFAASLRPDGLQLTAVPRDTPGMRLFYNLFADELNFGYRELITPSELRSILSSAGWQVVHEAATPSTCIAVSRPPA